MKSLVIYAAHLDLKVQPDLAAGGCSLKFQGIVASKARGEIRTRELLIYECEEYL